MTDTYSLWRQANPDASHFSAYQAGYEAAEALMADVYQAVGALIWHAGWSDNPDCIRILDVLAYGKTEDGVDLLPWPKQPLPAPETKE